MSVGISDADLRCPACGAATRPNAPWCTLCHASLLDAEPEPTAAPGDEAAAPPPPAQPRSRGRHAKGRASAPATGDEPPAQDAVPAEVVHLGDPGGAPPVTSLEDVDVDAMLALLAAQERTSVPLPPQLSSTLGDKTSRAVVITAGVALVSVLVFGLLALVGSLLT